MFDGFSLDTIDVGEARLRVRHGGAGPALLLLHGHPRTHTTWYRVAPLLAAEHTRSSAPTCAATGNRRSRPRRPTTSRTPSARWRATRCG